jgi:hypothetical protein
LDDEIVALNCLDCATNPSSIELATISQDLEKQKFKSLAKIYEIFLLKSLKLKTSLEIGPRIIPNNKLKMSLL